MKYKNLFLLILFSLLLTGCADKAFYYARYNFDLTEIEKPDKSKSRYDEKSIIKKDNQSFETYTFEDEFINIKWSPHARGFDFTLLNKTDNSIKIIWDEALIIDEIKRSLAVMHTGIKYSEKESSQVPSVVIRKGYLIDSVVPSQYAVYYDATYYKGKMLDPGGWTQEDFIPSIFWGYDDGVEKFKNRVKRDLVGKNIQVLLPIEITGVINDYIFTFKIDDMTLRLSE